VSSRIVHLSLSYLLVAVFLVGRVSRSGHFERVELGAMLPTRLFIGTGALKLYGAAADAGVFLLRARVRHGGTGRVAVAWSMA
jgi:hypothetical protein